MVVGNPPESLGSLAPTPPPPRQQHSTFHNSLGALVFIKELVKLRGEKNPRDSFLGVPMRDGVGVRGCLIWTPIRRLIRKELGASKTQHLNLSIVFPLGKGEEREQRQETIAHH